MSTPVAIACSSLCKHFAGVPAACGVDLSVVEGRFLALLGPSGCGKTTVLRMLAGLETPDRGTIHMTGREVFGPSGSMPPDQRRIGMVFQEYALFPHMSIEKNVAYGLPRGDARNERVDDVLRLVGLEHLHHRMPHELSGGQQQRVALARALAPGPSVILLDEPFSNLDAALRMRVRADVRSILKQAGVTAIFVTHDQEEALSLADEVAVMLDGKVHQTGSPHHIYLHPATHQVATFLGDANFLPGRGTGLHVECELGRLPTVRPFDGEGEVMFRPEDLQVERRHDGEATVEAVEYFGHDQLLRIALPSGTSLKSRLLGSRNTFHVGEKVALHMDVPVNVFPAPFGCPILPPGETSPSVLVPTGTGSISGEGT